MKGGFVASLLLLGAVLAFEPPSVRERTRAAGHLAGLDAEMRRAFQDDGEFRAKQAPKSHDWLAMHEEEGQSYDAWKASRPNLPDMDRRKLYILPLGDFDETSPDIGKLRSYTAAYYYPMPVEVLPAQANHEVGARSRVNGMSDKKQWNSEDILNWLPRKLPDDGYAMLAVTMTDLYPDESWNFVFGQASIKRRVGVFSFARYHPAWFGRKAEADTQALVLRRAAKVLTHEMGHMFGIRHCIHYECNMNGANHLEEADSTPMHLCPVCLRKLQYATKCDPASRYSKLEAFYSNHGLDEEKAWVTKREREIRMAK